MWREPKAAAPHLLRARSGGYGLMLVGDDDHRTPASEAEQFYQALKLRKVDTAMVRIPGASHAINARPSNMIAQVLNTIAWFEKHRSPAKSAK